MPRKVVFITGATGVVGSALVPLFLQSAETEVRLLIRANSPQHLQERMSELIQFWAPELQLDELQLSRIKPLRGDVSEPQLGLGDNEYQELTRELTHIVHSAANVKMNMSVQEAHKSSVVSAEEIVKLAEKCQLNGQLCKLEYVSTLGVAGRMLGLVPESPLDTPRDFHNTYESSKSEAEALILDKITNGLPVTIHRPSMVVGDSKTGKIIHFQIFYHLCTFLSGKPTQGFLPGLKGSCLDMIPVDYVAQAIVFSSDQQQTIGKVLHLCSGPDHSIKLDSLKEAVARHFARHGRAGRTTSVPPAIFRLLLLVIGLFSNAKGKRALKSLGLLLGYLDESKVQFFDNAETTALLADGGLELPAADTYLDNVLTYYLDSG
jgi:thioester reductase-like protein